MNTDDSDGSRASTALVDALRELYEKAGRPSSRRLAEQVGSISHTTVAETVSGRRMPTWQTLSAIVVALGGDTADFERLWTAANSADSGGSWGHRYKAAVRRIHSSLRFPQFDVDIRAELEQLYVEPKVIDANPRLHNTLIPMLELPLTARRGVVLAGPGAGKTTACHALAWTLAAPESKQIPFFIPLRELAQHVPDTKSLSDFIEHRLDAVYNCPAPRGAVDSAILDGRTVLIFDGLDEIPELSVRRQVASVLDTLAGSQTRASVFVTSRIPGYTQARLSSDLYDEYLLQPFNDEDVRRFVERWGAARGWSDEIIGQCYSQVHSDATLSELAKSPLMLSLLCEVFSHGNSLPKSRLAVLERLVVMAIDKWDATRGIAIPRDHRLIMGLLQRISLHVLDQGSMYGVPKSQLIAWSIAYLSGFGFEQRDSRSHATELIDYLTERSQLLIETGAARDGDPILTLSSRAFLEYFAACELVRHHPDATRLAEELAERLGRGDWDSIAELCIQYRANIFDEGAQELINELRTISLQGSGEVRARVTYFLDRYKNKGGRTTAYGDDKRLEVIPPTSARPAPIGFWSYVHLDDAAENGRIVQLARDIVARMEMETAEEIELFLDRDSINWGDRWRTVIDEGLSRVAFFIPVLTPRYFKSVECRRELQQFLRKADELGVKQLVMPILYVNVPALLEDMPDDNLIQLVQQFQWESWTELRLTDTNSAEYRRGVDRLANRLVAANTEAERLAGQLALSMQDTELNAGREDDEPGLLEVMADYEAALPELVGTTLELGASIDLVGELMSSATEELHLATSTAVGMAGRLRVTRALAASLTEPVERIFELSNDFASHLGSLDLGTKAFLESLESQDLHDRDQLDGVGEFFASIESFAQMTTSAVAATQGMADSIGPVEAISRDLRPVLRRLRHALTLLTEAAEVVKDWVQMIRRSRYYAKT